MNMIPNRSYLSIVALSATLFACGADGDRREEYLQHLGIKAGEWPGDAQMDDSVRGVFAGERGRGQYFAISTIRRFGSGEAVVVRKEGSDCSIDRRSGPDGKDRKVTPLGAAQCLPLLDDIRASLDNARIDGAPCVDGDVIYLEARLGANTYHGSNEGICSKYYSDLLAKVRGAIPGLR